MVEGIKHFVEQHKFKKEIQEQMLPSFITMGFAVILMFAGVFYFIPKLLGEFNATFEAAISPENLPPITRMLAKLAEPSISITITVIFVGLIIWVL